MVYGLSEQDFERLKRMIRWFEGRPPDRTNVAGGQVPNWQHVRCTGDPVSGDGEGSDGSGGSGSDDGLRYWPGQVVVWDAVAEEEKLLAQVWIYVWNDYRLKVGAIYDARESGRKKIGDDTRDVFVVSAAAAFPESLDDDGSGDGSGDGSDGSGTGGGCASGIPISDIIKCNGGKTEILDGCLDWTDGRLVIRDGDGTIIAGG